MKTKIVFLSGLLCDHTVWQKQIEYFSPQYCVETFEFSHLSSIQDMAKKVISNLHDRSIIVGHSMGARVALEVFRLAPQLVSKIALIDFGIHAVKTGETEKRFELIDAVRRHGMQYLIPHWLEPMVYLPNIAQIDIFSPMQKMVLGQTIESFEAQINALLTRPEVVDVFKCIRIPLYLGVGRQDHWSTLAQHEAMLEINPNADLHIYENSGHMSPLEAADQINTSLDKWILSNDQ
ncbi:alpha/beta fold hydrolase [Acinetobacter schindleri]|uniref:Alpha/beta hydrolase n=1 Tax=Acinetobacter schindleri TaxID=108981 RepID=A0AAE6WVU9_9GAMM|nr:alpha/beta hydrolase [Acinetobacter schindleri]QIC67878.1 alpha/beta hydrolase [Acinetobacter schindleri]